MAAIRVAEKGGAALSYVALLGWFLAGALFVAWRTAARENVLSAQRENIRMAQEMSDAGRETPERPSPSRVDPGKQALVMLRRGENCDWYSIKHTDQQLEAFDGLEIYWRTNVEQPEKRSVPHYGRGPFELKAGFRVRWYVAATHHSYVEAVGLDLMTTILEARENADRLIERAELAREMKHQHPLLETWKANGPGRKYDFNGLDIDKWSVRLDYPGGLSWSDAPELDQAVAEALAKAPA